MQRLCPHNTMLYDTSPCHRLAMINHTQTKLHLTTPLLYPNMQCLYATLSKNAMPLLHYASLCLYVTLLWITMPLHCHNLQRYALTQLCFTMPSQHNRVECNALTTPRRTMPLLYFLLHWALMRPIAIRKHHYARIGSNS